MTEHVRSIALTVNGEDVRERPLEWRRQKLEEIVDGTASDGHLVCSPVLEGTSWEELKTTREQARAEAAVS